MITPHYGLDAGKVQGNPLTAAEVNYIEKIIDSQIPGALNAIGVGVIVDDIANALDSTDLALSTDGFSVEVGAGAAVCNETTNGYGFIAVRFKTSQTLTLDDLAEGDNYVYVTPRYPAGSSTFDSRSGDEPKLTVLDSEIEDSGDGSLLLGYVEVESGTINTPVDMRKFVGGVELLRRIIQLETDVDYDDTERGKGTVSERLNALETDDGSGGNGITYIAPGKWEASDPRAASVVIAEMIANAVNDASSDSPIPMQLPEDRLGEAIMHTRDGLIRLNPAVVDAIEAAELVVGFAGHAVDGSPPPADGINDTDNILLYCSLQVDTANREMTP